MFTWRSHCRWGNISYNLISQRLRRKINLLLKYHLWISFCTTLFAWRSHSRRENISFRMISQRLRIKINLWDRVTRDPIPTGLVRKLADVLVAPNARLVNLSLTTGVFPEEMKLAHVLPLLKKPGLNPELLSNFRSISFLSFISKLLERVVVRTYSLKIVVIYSLKQWITS